jgi:hypothetical protein
MTRLGNILRAVLSDRDGCCSCEQGQADVLIEPTVNLPQGEPYCWPCIDTWPTSGPAPRPAYQVLHPRNDDHAADVDEM